MIKATKQGLKPSHKVRLSMKPPLDSISIGEERVESLAREMTIAIWIANISA